MCYGMHRRKCTTSSTSVIEPAAPESHPHPISPADSGVSREAVDFDNQANGVCELPTTEYADYESHYIRLHSFD